MNSLAHRLASWASSISFELAPIPVQQRLLYGIHDTLSVLLSGSLRTDIREFRDGFASGDGPSSVIGLGRGAAPSVAAFLNGIPVASEQLQDGHRLARGHPMSHLLPSVLAVGEAENASGSQVLTSLLIGYEVGVRLGMAMGGTPEGVHDIGTWATLGSCAAVGYLLSGGSMEVVEAAIELGASVPLAFDAKSVFEGASAQHLFLAIGCQNSVVVGYGASNGLRAQGNTLERFYLPRTSKNISSKSIEERISEISWSEYVILNGYHKIYPTCAHLHGVNEAVEKITLGLPLDPMQIDGVKVEVYESALEFLNPAPRNDLEARFSIPFTVAVALALGRLDNEAFNSPWLEDEIVRNLSRRVSVTHDPELDQHYPSGRPARVTVRMKDGQVKVSEVRVPTGDGPEALGSPLVRAKPFMLMSRSIGADMATKLGEAIDALPTGGLGALSRLLRSIKT